MTDHKGDRFYNRVGGDRIESRQIDELIGLSRGLIADDVVNQSEIEFLQKWLAANSEISEQPVIRVLCTRANENLSDGIATEDEKIDLFETLQRFSSTDIELGEVLKPTSLPLCNPPPDLIFPGVRYCFTGTFNYGHRRECESAVIDRGAEVGGLTQKTRVLVIGAYATDSWKHSTFGNKIIRACEWRDEGMPISIVSEQHWRSFL